MDRGNEMDNLSDKNTLPDSSVEIKFISELKVSKSYSNVDRTENKTMSETVLDDLLKEEDILLDRFDDLSMNLQHQTLNGSVKNGENTDGKNVVKTFNDVASSPIIPDGNYQHDNHEILNNEITSSFCRAVNEPNNLDNFSVIQEGEESPLSKLKINSFSSSFITFQEELFPEISTNNTSPEIDSAKVTYLELKSSSSKQDSLNDSHDESTVSNSCNSNSSFYTSQQNSSENEKIDFENKVDNYFEYKMLNLETHSERSERKDSKFEDTPLENTPENYIEQDNKQNYAEYSDEEISDKIKVGEFQKTIKDNSLSPKEIDVLENSSIVPKKEISSVPSSRQIRPNISTNSYTTFSDHKKNENISISSIGIKVPSEEISSKIISNVEFYFSNFNILKNNFLLKHIRKNKEGYVSVKLITSFRKVKAITRDWRVVSYCLEGSKMLELNSEKNKVRRIEPVPKIEDTSFGKTIVVFNLPFLKPSSENLKELFSKFGPVVNAEIMTTKSKNYNIYHKKCLFFNQDVASQVFGLVEFENYKDLQRAVKDEEGYLPKQNIMNVVPLVAKYFGPKLKNFRFRSNFSYPRSSVERFNQQRSKYYRDVYSSYTPIDIKSNKSHSSEENIPRRNYPYYANQGRWYYPPRDLPNYCSRLNCPYYSQAAAYDKRYIDSGQRTSESWRQNRQLKSNTSMNIESRTVSSIRKTGVVATNK